MSAMTIVCHGIPVNCEASRDSDGNHVIETIELTHLYSAARKKREAAIKEIRGSVEADYTAEELREALRQGPVAICDGVKLVGGITIKKGESKGAREPFEGMEGVSRGIKRRRWVITVYAGDDDRVDLQHAQKKATAWLKATLAAIISDTVDTAEIFGTASGAVLMKAEVKEPSSEHEIAESKAKAVKANKILSLLAKGVTSVLGEDGKRVRLPDMEEQAAYKELFERATKSIESAQRTVEAGGIHDALYSHLEGVWAIALLGEVMGTNELLRK